MSSFLKLADEVAERVILAGGSTENTQCCLTGNFRLILLCRGLRCLSPHPRQAALLSHWKLIYKQNKTKQNKNCHSFNAVSRNRLTTVKPHCETSSDGYLTMAMAEDQPPLTVRLRLPMQIKLCGRTYRVSCHEKKNLLSSKQRAIMTKVAGSQPFQVKK